MKINKLSVLFALSLCLICSCLKISAHAGHDHGSEFSIRDYINKKFEIVIDGEHIGHFYIKRTNRQGTKLRLEQTLHAETADKVFKNVIATYDDDKTLYYFIKDGTSSYIFWSDFSKLDGADNAGLRVTYSTEPEARTVSSVNTIVRLVEAETQH